jgi:YVTN family beta-propeller protein
MKKIKFSFLAVALIALAVSCKKNDASTVLPLVTNGVYVLNQGNYGHNNTTFTYYDFATAIATTDYYKDVNQSSLGDGGSDFIVYGGKIYIVMNSSGNVTVANAHTAKLIDTVSFIIGGINKQPENIVAYGNNVFVSSTDGTVAVIDTATLAITKEIIVGTNPAQMVVAGSNLYVSNTGAIAAFTSYIYDSTLSVINLSTLTETTKIKVGMNPGALVTDNAGNVYVACAGDYTPANPALLAKVSIATNSVVFTADTAVYSMRYYNNLLYVTPAYGSTAASLRALNTTDFSAVHPSFITDGTVITAAYGLDIDPSNGDVYVDDARDYKSSGEVYCFDQTGKKKLSFTVAPGISPCKVVLIHQ